MQVPISDDEAVACLMIPWSLLHTLISKYQDANSCFQQERAAGCGYGTLGMTRHM